jgi:hypothetical protein
MKIKRRSEQPRLQRKFGERCGYCRKRVGDEDPVVSFGAKVREGVDLAKIEASVIELYVTTLGKKVLAAVSSFESEAKAAGSDIIFMTCSEECGKALRDAIADEVALGDEIAKILRLRK